MLSIGWVCGDAAVLPWQKRPLPGTGMQKEPVATTITLGHAVVPSYVVCVQVRRNEGETVSKPDCRDRGEGGRLAHMWLPVRILTGIPLRREDLAHGAFGASIGRPQRCRLQHSEVPDARVGVAPAVVDDVAV